MSDTHRCFTAIELTEDALDTLTRVQDRLRRFDADVRWVRRETMHLTLKFFGDVEAATLPKLTNTLRSIELPAIEWEVAGLGQFPPRGNPRVVWAGTRGDTDALLALADAIATASEGLVAPDGKPFRPHVTLGRVQGPRHARELVAALAQLNPRVSLPPVRSFTLFESELRPEGPHYRALERFEFARGTD